MIMKEIKPTARDLRVAYAAVFAGPIHSSIYNDLRVNGGRLKISGLKLENGDMRVLQKRLELMFPVHKIDVYRHFSSTCIHYTNA